jgi:nucleoside-diphosphate-sugar epimerase
MALKHDDSTFSPTTYATAVIGSGTIGSRIALMLASGGGEVRLYDPNADQLEAARRYVEAELPRVVAGRSGALPGRLVLSRTLQAAVTDTWMVVEAIPERLDLKRKMFGDLDRLASSARRCDPSKQFVVLSNEPVNRRRLAPWPSSQHPLLRRAA